jgi:hypothetical protein
MPMKFFRNQGFISLVACATGKMLSLMHGLESLLTRLLYSGVDVLLLGRITMASAGRGNVHQ